METRKINAGGLAVSALWMLVVTCIAPPAFATQAPGGNEVCGDGSTFTVELPATVTLAPGLGGLDIDTTDHVTLPKGCRIYAFHARALGEMSASLPQSNMKGEAKSTCFVWMCKMLHHVPGAPRLGV
jgi:hypothetical protein